MKRIFARLVGPVLGLSLCLLPVSVLAAINLPFSTTYNCPEQSQITIGWVNCDGISKGGDWTTNAGAKEQITTAANYPGGGGGRGQRHWIGNGMNDASGIVKYNLSTSVSEVWIRFYTRWQSGLELNSSNGQKLIYWSSLCGGGNGCYLNLNAGNVLRVVVAGNPYATSNFGWEALNGGSSQSNGNWNCIEAHFKAETSVGVKNGVSQVWVNGTLRHERTDIGYLGLTPFDGFNFPSNHIATTVGGLDMFHDLDDVAISKTGRIGCVGTTPPAAPQNLQLTP